MNLPNKITLSRILMIPLIVFFYLADFVPYGKVIALVIYILSAVTDFLDGYIARKYNLITNLGKFMDPIADKMLTISVLILVICDGTVPMPYGAIAAIIILAREFIVSALRQIASTKNIVIAADMWGKVKTNFQLVSFGALMLLSFLTKNTNYNGTGIEIFSIINWVLLGCTVLLTVISGINYLIKNRKVFGDEK